MTSPYAPIVTGKPQGPLVGRKLSVSEMMASNARGGPNISAVTDPRTGRRLTEAEAAARGPFTIFGGGSGGGRGYGRGYGGGGVGFNGGSRISSAGVAGGTPTSRTGRADLAMQQDPTLAPEDAWAGAEAPSWDQPRPDPFAPNPRYGRMGRPPIRGTSGNLDLNVTGYAKGTDDSGDKSRVAVLREGGRPEALVLPPHSKVIPLTDSAWGQSAIEQVMGAEERPPVNPYIGNENAPSPNAFRATAAERYADLGMRLDALRQSGFAEGRAAVARLRGQQAEEQAKTQAFLSTGQQVAPEDGGGKLYRTPYGHAIVGSNRPKSFTVENFEGAQTTSPDLAAVDRESRADAAERTVRGLGTRSYRALPTEVPRTVEQEPPSAIDEVPVSEPPVLAGAPRPTAPPRQSSPTASVGVIAPSALDEIENASVVSPPTNDMERPALKSKAAEAVDGLLGRIGEIASGSVKIAKDVWDSLFTAGGTDEQRKARAEHDKLTTEQKKKYNEELKTAMEKRGYKVTIGKDGYILTEQVK